LQEWISRFLDAKNNNGKTAADVARDKNHPSIADKIDQAKRMVFTTQAVSQVELMLCIV
jgi:phage-related protein